MMAYASCQESAEERSRRLFLGRLLRAANDHCDDAEWDPVEWLYRNKPREYFRDIKQKHNNIMKKYMKDNGGDPDCPLNGKLEGLFFGVTLIQGELPDKSPFGNFRVIMPLHEAFDQRTNLYFADFFCLRRCTDNHYVQLVLAKKGSSSDIFCRKHLISLDPEDNNFLIKIGNHYATINQMKVKLEIFYTEDINLNGRPRSETDTFGGQGHSSPGGIPKKPYCKVCNVHKGDLPHQCE